MENKMKDKTHDKADEYVIICCNAIVSAYEILKPENKRR